MPLLLFTGREEIQKCVERSSADKDLAFLVDDRLAFSQQCAWGPKGQMGFWGALLHPKSMASRSRAQILPLCSALIKPHLEYCIQHLITSK